MLGSYRLGLYRTRHLVVGSDWDDIEVRSHNSP
jgi:hypothetical protein